MSTSNEVKAESLGPEDFESIRKAVMETPRGRWFLAEYENRFRTGETAGLFDNIKRLESVMASNHHTLMQRLAEALEADPAPGQAPAPQADLAPKHMKFFKKDEDIFEPAPPQARIAPVPETPKPETRKGAKLIIHRSNKPVTGPETSPEEEVSVPLPAPPAVTPEPQAEAAKVEGEPKSRIVIIRHKPGEEIDVPLQREMAEAS